MESNQDYAWFQAMQIGEEVFWEDPDLLSSGYYVIDEIRGDEELPLTGETIIDLSNEAGSKVQARLSELHPGRPAHLHPVVDEESTSVPLGYARDRADVDRIVANAGIGNVVDAQLRDGQLLESGALSASAWLVTLSGRPDEAILHLALEVRYRDALGESEHLVGNLYRLVSRGTGEGLLTGGLDAYVDTHASHVFQVTPAADALDEEQIASWVSRQIEEGHFSLEDLPLRMARWALTHPAQLRNEIAERMIQSAAD